jgi:hypothetical protein
MVRNNFSISREHFQRRSPISEEDAIVWIERLRNLLATENKDLVLNDDETTRRVSSSHILIYWDTGAVDLSISAMEMKNV